MQCTAFCWTEDYAVQQFSG